MKINFKWIGVGLLCFFIALMFINKPRPASANCNGCGENDHSNQCNLEHDHEHKPAEKVLIEEHKDSTSEPENGVVFAVCIFAIAEDGSRIKEKQKEITEIQRREVKTIQVQLCLL